MAVYNINDYKKNRHSKLRKLKYILWAFFITYILLYFLTHYKYYSIQSLQRAMDYVSLAHNTGEIDEDFSVIIERNTKYNLFKNGFVTLDRDILTYINAASLVDTQILYAYQNADMVVGNNQIITFDRNGYEYSISNSYGELLSQTTNSKILDISISKNDYYAVITDEASYISAIAVYNNLNKEIFKWSTSTYNVVSAIIDDTGDYMIALCVYQKDANLTTEIILFDISKKEIVNQTSILDQIPIDSIFLNNGNIAVILNGAICILDKDLQTIFYDDVTNLHAYNIENSHNILYATEDVFGVLVTIINSQGELITNSSLDLVIKGYIVSNNEFYILTSDFIYKYDFEFNLLNEIANENNYTGIIYNNSLYGIYSGGAKKLF